MCRGSLETYLDSGNDRSRNRSCPRRAAATIPSICSVKKLSLILFFLLSFSGTVWASDWRQEINRRWGFSLSYPKSLIPEPLPTNGGGRRYHSADHEVSLVAMGAHTHAEVPDESLDGFWQKELDDRGHTVTYRFKKNNFYVISGSNANGYEFYHKVFFFPGYWVEFEMTYPHSQRQRYDEWVKRIAREFVPTQPDNGQYDR
jgi:hypothetical protein